MQQCDPSTCDHALLTYIINFTQNLTIGPLDYCGIACRIKGRGDDVIKYCKADPRVPQFYHHCYALGVATAKLKIRDEEKKGLATNTLAAVKREVEKVQVNIQLTVEKENVKDLEITGKQKKRHLVAADSEYSFKSPCNTDGKVGRADLIKVLEN
ncbi:hypothetical protein B0H13DRAFT_2336088 [Mycena leptocephala]|nr:hypothetical protein B0H13DRAFT_2336088 [Mycena leptocephala]